MPQALGPTSPRRATPVGTVRATARSIFSSRRRGRPPARPSRPVAGLNNGRRLSICLASRFPMLVWWGPDLVMLYNAAYHPMLGGTYPRAFVFWPAGVAGDLGRHRADARPGLWWRGWGYASPTANCRPAPLFPPQRSYPKEGYFTYSTALSPTSPAVSAGCLRGDRDDQAGKKRPPRHGSRTWRTSIRAGPASDVIETANVVLAGNPHDHPGPRRRPGPGNRRESRAVQVRPGLHPPGTAPGSRTSSVRSGAPGAGPGSRPTPRPRPSA